MEIEEQVFEVTEEMLDCAERYARLVKVLRHDAVFSAVEQRVDLSWILHRFGIEEPIFGTADFIAYDAKTKTLWVVDFKYGKGVVVDAKKNPQPRCYAVGALDLPELRPYRDDIKWVRTVIVQPRAGDDALRFEDITIEELGEWVETELVPAARRIGEGDTSENAGEHCRWCVRAGTCSALFETSIASCREAFADDVSTTPSTVTPADLDNDRLAEILTKAAMVEGWVEQVRAEAIRRLEVGGEIPGYKLVPKRATRKWADADKAFKTFVEMLGQDALEPAALKSPAQIEKLLKKSRFETDSLEAHVSRVSSGVTLAREEDKRPAVQNATALLFDDAK
jgi:hypothetical protein